MFKKLIGALVGLAMMGMAGSANATLIEITEADLLADAMVLDFESGTPGSITGTDTLFTDFGLSNVSLVGSFSGFDVLDSGVFGNALVSFNNTLTIAAPGDEFTNQLAGAGFIFEWTTGFEQFGFRVVDQADNTLTISTFFDGLLIDTIQIVNNLGDPGPFPNPIRYFESSAAIDEIQILAVGGAGGWGVDDLTVACKVPEICQTEPPPAPVGVPEPSTLILFGIGLAGLGFMTRRRRNRRRQT